jgi:hypothetical protein
MAFPFFKQGETAEKIGGLIIEVLERKSRAGAPEARKQDRSAETRLLEDKDCEQECKLAALLQAAAGCHKLEELESEANRSMALCRATARRSHLVR